MSIISSKNVNQIVLKTLSIVNPRVMEHGEIVGYFLYKMLQAEGIYTREQLAEYTMLGVLHDIGLYREDDIKSVTDFEFTNIWTHSIYGFLFLKNFSPMGEKAEIVLYHHLDYNRYGLIQSRYLPVIACLNLADKMDAFMHMKTGKMEPDYFARYRNEKFSGRALDLFMKAEEKFHIAQNLKDGSYKKELEELFADSVYSESDKKKFLEMLVYTIDFRSEYTVIHTMATVNFSQQIALMMGLDAKDMRNLYYGALLHDLGKLAIPVSILESNGRLSVKEMRIMRAHVRITEMILEGIIDDEVLQIAVRHHEKLDGSGYHHGYVTDQLTLPQQIIAVADILSALHGKRSYKESFDSGMVKQILNEDAENNKINRQAVDCVLRNYDQIIQTFEAEKEETVGLYLKIKDQFNEISKQFNNIT